MTARRRSIPTPTPEVRPPHVWQVAPLGRERRCGQQIATVRQLVMGRAGVRERPVYHLPSYQRAHVWTIDQSAAYLSRVMSGLPGGTILVWERRDALFLIDGQQRLTALGCDVRRADGTPNLSPTLYLDMSAAREGRISWVGERVAEDDPTPVDLCGWDWARAYYDAHPDDLYRDAMHRAMEALQQAEVHVLTAGGWGGNCITADDVREIFASVNTGGTPMSAADVAALLALGDP